MELEAGHVDAAWADFIERYHRLIDATIRRSLPEHDDALDAFAHVCERLSSCDLARLRKFSDRSAEGAKFSTWLVAVVRNLTVDFIRGRDGRPRTEPPPSLTELRRRIYHMVLLEHCSHIESYERLLAQGEKLRFGEFLRHLVHVYRAADGRRRAAIAFHARSITVPISDAISVDVDDEEGHEQRERATRALAELSTDERRAVELFIVEGKSAAEVARAIGWGSSKTVYDRVRRALTKIRTAMPQEEMSTSRSTVGPNGVL